MLQLVLFSPFPKASMSLPWSTVCSPLELRGMQVPPRAGRAGRVGKEQEEAQAGPVLGDLGFPCRCTTPWPAREPGLGSRGRWEPRMPGGMTAVDAVPAATAQQLTVLTQAAISSHCSGTADFNVNFLLLPFEINTASSLILPVA